jgi:hypothetical protein
MTLNQIRKNPIIAQALAIPEEVPVWKPVLNEIDGKKLRVWAWRAFDQKESNRDFKLGTTKKWAVGFFDMSGPAAFSQDMELTLDSDWRSQRTNTGVGGFFKNIYNTAFGNK